MADNEKKKSGPPRIALGDYKAARHSLARIIRLRFRKEIDSDLFRDLVYGLNALLGFDKFEKESALEKRLSDLENRRGQITLAITPEEAIGLDPDEREARIIELLEKGGYMEKMGYTEIPATSDVTPEPVPVIPELPEPQQPQPRRLKL
jgi:hypothetical protein